MNRPSEPIPGPNGPEGGPKGPQGGPKGSDVGPAKSWRRPSVSTHPTHHVCPSTLDALMVTSSLASVGDYLAAVLDMVAPIVGGSPDMVRLASSLPTNAPRGT